jgi:hypothetical protein
MTKKKRTNTKKLKYDFSKGLHFVLVSTVIIVMVILFGFLFSKNSLLEDEVENTRQKLKMAETNSVVQIQDFPSDKEGTFRGVLQKEYYKDSLDKIVILFASAKVPGLTILYYPDQNRIVAGSPQMSADNIVLFDGKHHELAYSFKENGDQTLYYDGNLVATSKFNPLKNSLTGLVTGTSESFVFDGFDEFKID